MAAKKAKTRAPKVEKKPWVPDPRGPQHILPKFLKKVEPRPPEERPPPRTVEPVQPPRRDLELPQGRRSVKEVLIAAGNGEYLKNIPVAWHGLPPEDVAQRMASWLEREEKSHRMRDFKPYPKQQEFFALTAINREVALFGGNQSGKTFSASMVCAFHATGNYPEDYTGHRFKKAPRMWVASLNYEFLRDNAQKHICGSPDEIGTGSLPFKSIIKMVKRAGVQDALDSITVRHITGGVSRIKFKSYEEGREGFQGETLDFYWLDEEPKDYEIYTEVLTRISATKGRGVITFTPLLGATNTVNRFLLDKAPGTAYTVMTIHDALHYTDEERAAIIAAWPAHERRARELGMPNQGTGTVFSSIDPEFIKYENIPVQDHWYRIAGMDFGIKDPTVLAYIAHDREADVYYLYDLYHKTDSLPPEHYQAWRSRGDNIPVAWPADGLKRGPNDGVQLAAEYQRLGMKMLDEPALLPEVEDKKDGQLKTARNSVEAGLRILIAIMSEGRFKVAAHLEEFWNEFRLYYRDKNGKLVDANNHVIDACRMAISMELQGFGEQGTRSTPYHYHKRQGGYRSRYG